MGTPKKKSAESIVKDIRNNYASYFQCRTKDFEPIDMAISSIGAILQVRQIGKKEMQSNKKNAI